MDPNLTYYLREHAYVVSQSACALIEAMGMVAENQQAFHRGENMVYTSDAFLKLQEKYSIGHNAVIGGFQI